MKEMQFSIVVLATLMCSALILLLPDRVRRDEVVNRSRWFMTGALALLGVQFLVQYVTQLRAMGVTQAVVVNLLFFVPASGLMNLTVLNTQRQGRLSRVERWLWVAVSLVVTVTLAVVVGTDDHDMRHLSDRVRWAEIVLGIVYATMQVYYSGQQFRELKRMTEAIEDYYDRERRGLTTWMRHAIAVTGLLAMFVPVLIFGPNIVLAVYALLFFWGIFTMWFCFIRFFISNDLLRIREAEDSAAESSSEEHSEEQGDSHNGTLSADALQNVSRAVERWLATGAYLTAGITSPMAADAMNIPRYQLTAWVKASGHSSFTRWMTALRVEEAKRVLAERPDWTNEAVADHCGFSRAYFQKIFKRETGLAPSVFTSRQHRQ